MSAKKTVDATLLNWADLGIEGADGLLIGNGASQAIWKRFRYASLYEEAKSEELDHPLSEADQAMFAAFSTTNFERVLEALLGTQKVLDALDHDYPQVRERYEGIRMGLVEAVQKVHVKWADVPEDVRKRFAGILRGYRYVYSTNYDLLIYWAIMSVDAHGFTDHFFDEAFDLSDTEISDSDWTRIFYLHGALHLFRHGSRTFKRRRRPFENLLELFGDPHDEGAIPLFVSEGSSEEKIATINTSDYLGFAYNRFANHDGTLVVFGHSLGDHDAHLLTAMSRREGREIAIGLVPDTEERTIFQKARLMEKLPEAELLFYDSTTHPLGAEDMRVG